ncbi:MAG TPA: transcription termination/antitermination NusG family protein [Gemmatimonadaceae bacterium]
MSSGTEELCWRLLYTKPRAEEWVEINLRKQGFATLLPRVRGRSGFGPLFPRYLFAGFDGEQNPRPMRSTLGVLYVVHCGDQPARVAPEVIDEVRGRMDPHGVVTVESAPAQDPLFAKRERERTRALVKLVEAGWRVQAG